MDQEALQTCAITAAQVTTVSHASACSSFHNKVDKRTKSTRDACGPAGPFLLGGFSDGGIEPTILR